MGARRERRRTMMGDSYFTSVSTGGIGMAPGLLRRKRPARRSLSQSTRARPHSTNSAFRVDFSDFGVMRWREGQAQVTRAAFAAARKFTAL